MHGKVHRCLKLGRMGILNILAILSETWVHRRLIACKCSPHIQRQHIYTLYSYNRKLQNITVLNAIKSYNKRQWRRADQNAVLFDNCKMWTGIVLVSVNIERETIS